jgi:hypothetical protein
MRGAAGRRNSRIEPDLAYTYVVLFRSLVVS